MQPPKTIDYVTPKFEEWHGLKAGPSYVHISKKRMSYLAPWKFPCQSSKKFLDSWHELWNVLNFNRNTEIVSHTLDASIQDVFIRDISYNRHSYSKRNETGT